MFGKMHIAKINIKKVLILFLLSCIFLNLYGQKSSQENMIRIALWAERDAYPGVFDEAENKKTEESNIKEEDFNEFSVAIKKIKEITPFILTGMIYGWNVEYVPYDKARNVQEYFSFTPIQTLSKEETLAIRYKKPWVDESRLWCWIEYDRTEFQKKLYESWKSIKTPKVRGEGFANLSEGFYGIEEAFSQAMKNTVREYWRKRIKNKPREISGRLYLCEPPLIGIDSGRYKVTLDFFMETDRIIEYKMF